MQTESRKRTHRSTRAIVGGFFIAAAFAACNGSDKATGPVSAASVLISAPGGTTAVGGTIQFTATIKDANGNALSRTPTWAVAHGGGTISAAGLFTAGDSMGTFTNTIVATSGSVSATSTVVVTSGALSTITITPDTVSVATGATQQYTAVAKDSHGNVVAMTPVWSVAAGGGTIDSTGLFTADTVAGTFANSITVTSGGSSAHASVTVLPGALASITVTPGTPSMAAGATQQYTAVGKDAYNNVVAITPVWNVVASGGTINSEGLFTAGSAAGTFTNTVRASVGVCSSAIFGYASATVQAGALASITVTPATVSLATGATQQFTAVGKDANDNVVAITPTWSVLAGGGTISNGGLFTAGTTAGTFTNTVVVTSGSLAATATVTVTAGPLSSLVITTGATSVGVGGTQQYTVVGKDANGNTVPVTATWSVTAGGGTISSSGLFTAGTTAGTYTNTITVTSGTVTSQVTVTIAPGALFAINVTPQNPNVVSPATKKFNATGVDSFGNTVAITPTWSVSPSIGTIDSTGLFTPKTGTTGTFPNAISATVGTITGTASLKVS